MLARRVTVALALLLGAPALATAQDFGVMESAEIIQRGNLKFTAYPMFVLGEGEADGTVGGVLRGGYGFSERVDGELGLAFYDGGLLFGGNLELGLLRAVPGTRGLDLSVRGGAHLVQGEVADGVGLDVAGLLSAHLTRNLEVVGSLDFGHTFHDEPFEDANTLHLVPGVEYRVTDYLDFLAEFGLGLDDEAAHYLAAGLALYFR